MTRDAFENLTALGSVLRSVFMEQMTAVADTGANDVLSLYNILTSARAREINQGMGGFGNVPEYQGTLEYSAFELLYQNAYTHKEYAQGLAIERKLIDDDEYGAMAQRARLLGMAFDRTVYTHAASLFNNAFSASFLGGDAVALCSASHPRSASQSATQSNAGTTALSHDAVVTTRIAMMKYTDSEGSPLNINPDVLLVPIDLEPTARVIVGSQQRSGSANNDANVNGTYRVVGSRYLTDANNWFLIDSQMAKMYLNWFWRVQPEFAEDPTSDYSLVAKYRGYARWSYGWDHWAWIYGHNVS
jgi:phage major head subunit gpT-like protein